MTQTEALKLALEAMNECRFDDRWYAAKEAIKEALVQTEQELIQHCEAGPEYCWKCNEEIKPTYGSEEIRKLREVNKSLNDHIVDANKKVEPPPWWPAIENILNEYGLQAIDFVADFKAALAQSEQEPVAWLYEREHSITNVHLEQVEGAISRGWVEIPLYTTPPQRTWVGLNLDERAACYEASGGNLSKFANQIEAKLKGKNT